MLMLESLILEERPSQILKKRHSMTVVQQGPGFLERGLSYLSGFRISVLSQLGKAQTELKLCWRDCCCYGQSAPSETVSHPVQGLRSPTLGLSLSPPAGQISQASFGQRRGVSELWVSNCKGHSLLSRMNPPSSVQELAHSSTDHNLRQTMWKSFGFN